MSDTPLQRLIARINNSERAVWVFCGDSITHGALHTQGWRDYVELIEERVRYEKGKGLHLFANSAISGHTTRQIQAQFDHRVARFQPDFFALMIGMNDCADHRQMSLKEFGDNLRDIVTRVRRETPAEVLLQTCCAIHPELTRERSPYPQFMETVREVATELETALVDHHATWEKTRVENRPLFDSWMANAFHPNALGHWGFAERVLKDLEIGPLEKTLPPEMPSNART